MEDFMPFSDEPKHLNNCHQKVDFDVLSQQDKPVLTQALACDKLEIFFFTTD
jgi:hypothetical protein